MVLIGLFIFIVNLLLAFLTPSEQSIQHVKNDLVDLIWDVIRGKIALQLSFDSFLRILRDDFDTP